MPTLDVVPQRESYTLKNGMAWQQFDAEGGLPRTRLEYPNAEPTLTVQWLCGPTAFSRLNQFHEASACRNYENFDLDLYLDDQELVTCSVRFVPGSFKLQSHQGSSYVVAAELVLSVVRAAVPWPEL